MPAPTLVHFEQQIDAELLRVDDGATVTAAVADCRGVADGQEDGTQLELTATNSICRKPVVEVDWMSLDEMVYCFVVHFVVLKIYSIRLGLNSGTRCNNC